MCRDFCSAFPVMVMEAAASETSWYFLEMQILGPLVRPESPVWFNKFLGDFDAYSHWKALICVPSGDPSNRNMGFPEGLLVR